MHGEWGQSARVVARVAVAAAIFARLSRISILSAATVICSTMSRMRLFISTGGAASHRLESDARVPGTNCVPASSPIPGFDGGPCAGDGTGVALRESGRVRR